MQPLLLNEARARRRAHDAAPSAAGWRILLSGLLAGAAVELPAGLHGASTSWAWAALGVLAGLVAGAAWGPGAALRGVRHPWLACVLATGAGTVADFAATPPEALLALCTGTSGLEAGAIADHLRGLPTTTWVTLPVLVAARLGVRGQAGAGPGMPSYAGALLSIGAEFCAMQASMILAAGVARAVAARVGLPWTCDGISAAMTVGMLASFQARTLVGRVLRRAG